MHRSLIFIGQMKQFHFIASIRIEPSKNLGSYRSEFGKDKKCRQSNDEIHEFFASATVEHCYLAGWAYNFDAFILLINFAWRSSGD